MLRFWYFLAIFTVLGFVARASPATDFYSQVADLLKEHLVVQDGLEATLNRFRLELDRACEPVGERCAPMVATAMTQKMLKALKQPHTTLYSPDFFSGLLNVLDGIQDDETGTGLVTIRPFGSNERVVLDTISSSPSAALDFQRGDRLISVKGIAFPTVNDGLSFDDLIHQAQERQNQNLLAIRAGETLEIELMRYKIGKIKIRIVGATYPIARLPSLHPMSLYPGLAILRVPSFGSPHTADQIHALVGQAQSLGITKLVLDLRENPGGRSAECIKAAGAFVDRVNRIRKSRHGTERDEFENGQLQVFSEDGAVLERETVLEPSKWNRPIVVLVNDQTASCGEYFASEMQWQKRAMVIGQVTAGIGNSAAELFLLTNSWGLQITTSLTFHNEGNPLSPSVFPDVEVVNAWAKLFTGRDVILEKAIQILQNP
jgi:carboxyl-terminal processing protease